MPLSQALDSNDAEMTKRLKYTKDILTSMLNNGGNGILPVNLLLEFLKVLFRNNLCPR